MGFLAVGPSDIDEKHKWTTPPCKGCGVKLPYSATATCGVYGCELNGKRVPRDGYTNTGKTPQV